MGGEHVNAAPHVNPPTLNLLPREYLNRGYRAAEAFFRVVAVFSFIALIGLLLFLRYQTLTAYRERADFARQAYARYAPVLDKDATLRKLQAVVGEKEGFITQASPTVPLNESLAVVSSSMPLGIKLTSTSVVQGGPAQVSGVSPNLTMVAQLMVELEESGHFSDLLATFPSPLGPTGDNERVSFVLSGTWAGGPETETETETEVEQEGEGQ